MKITLGITRSFILPGRRETQEDSRRPDEDVIDGNRSVFIVCDGVGGHSHGEVAGATVADALDRALAGRDLSGPFSAADFDKALDKAYDRLNDVATPDRRDMATTMAAVVFHGAGCMAAHIGDSRIYHIRPGVGTLYRSEDHSLVNAMVRSGAITPEEALTHPRRNIITRSISPTIGHEERSRAAITQITDLTSGDYMFICSDGVLENISDNKLVEILSAADSDSHKIKSIRDMCINAADNSTVFLIPVADVDRDDISRRRSGAASFLRKLFK